MKRLKLLLLTALGACALLALCSCGGCKHELTSVKMLRSEATCTSPAIYYYTCKCGENTDEFTEGAALGHSFVAYVSNGDAGCEKNSTETAKCERCDATDTRAVLNTALGHSFVTYVSNGDAGCEDDGTETAKCERCDKTDTRTEPNSALGHSFITYTYNEDAECEENGTETARCVRCDKTDTRVAEETERGHWFKTYISNADATCAGDGTETAKCERCEATNTRTAVGSRLEHSYSDEWSKNETHHWHEASCGHTAKADEELHNYVNDICTECGFDKPTALLESISDAVIYGTEVYIPTKSSTAVNAITNIVCSEGAVYEVYTDAACTTELTMGRTLSDGENIFYLKVTSADGLSSLIYTVTVFKSFRANVIYKHGDTVLYTAEIDTGYGYTFDYKPSDITGYTFIGWLYENELVTEGIVFDEITLQARFDANKYTVTFEGAALEENELEITFGQDYGMPEPAKKTGYVFIGWFDEGGNEYDGKNWSHVGDITLTARYEIRQCTVTLDPDGGTVSTYSTVIQYGNVYTLPEPTREGYNFVCWVDADGNEYRGGAWSYDGDIKLTAKYSGKQYTVTLDPDGGTVSKLTVTVTFGEKCTIPTPTKNGYTFLGWADESGAYYTGEAWSKTSGGTLTANWKQNGIQLPFLPIND